MPEALIPVIRIAKYTILDDMRQKSLLVMLVICALFVVLVRGCYSGSYMMNGQALDAQTIVLFISRITFHFIAAGTMLLAALLSMRLFRRDREEGMMACILSKPVDRWQYIAGKVLGVWVLSAVFMFLLHGMVCVFTSIALKVFLPQYLAASLLCSLNLLFVVLAVLLLSLMLPDIVAFLGVLAVGVVGLAVDGIWAVSHNPAFQQMMRPSGSLQEVTGWQVLYYLWPKLSGIQQIASSLIGSAPFRDAWSLYPLVNLVLYLLILAALLLWRFRREDID